MLAQSRLVSISEDDIVSKEEFEKLFSISLDEVEPLSDDEIE